MHDNEITHSRTITVPLPAIPASFSFGIANPRCIQVSSFVRPESLIRQRIDHKLLSGGLVIHDELESATS